MKTLPLKQTSSINMKVPLSHILKKYFDIWNDSESTADRILTQIQEARDEVSVYSCRGGLEAALSVFGYYLSILVILEKHLNDKKMQQEFTFVWTDTLKAKRPVEYTAFRNEILCLVYNCGAIYSDLGLLEDRNTEAGLKNAIQYFRMSASIFSFLKNQLLNKPIFPCTFDLKESALAMNIAMMLAQAQQCLYEKAVMNKVNRSLMAGLSSNVATTYDSAIYYSEMLAPDNDGNLDSWFKIQKKAFTSVAHYHAALAEKELFQESGTGIGTVIAYLKKSQQLCKDAITFAAQSKIRVDISLLSDGISTELQQLEYDNQTVNMENIPPLTSIKQPDGITGIVIEHLNFQTILSRIQTVHQSTSEIEMFFSQLIPQNFQMEIKEYRNELLRIYHCCKTYLNEQLAEVQLFLKAEGLPFAIEPESFPDSLYSRVQDVKMKGGPKAIPPLISFLDDSGRECEMNCTKQRNRLGRNPMIDNTSLLNQIEEIETKLLGAKRVNAQLRTQFTSIQNQDVFEKSLEALASSVPTHHLSRPSEARGTKKSLCALDVAVARAEASLAQLHEKAENHESFLSSMLQTQSSKEIYDLKRHESLKAREWNDDTTQQIENITQVMQQCKKSWEREKLAMGGSRNSKYFMAVENACTELMDIFIRGAEGSVFYSKIMESLKHIAKKLDN